MMTGFNVLLTSWRSGVGYGILLEPAGVAGVVDVGDDVAGGGHFFLAVPPGYCSGEGDQRSKTDLAGDGEAVFPSGEERTGQQGSRGREGEG